jgi:S-adenosyl methyltransferase
MTAGQVPPAARESRGSRGFDARVAHPARVYDYWLGGKDNFEADRIAGEATIAAYPAIQASARANRAFLARSVRFLVISHAASDISPAEMAEMIRRMNEHLAEGNHVGRPRQVVVRFFDGLELVEPGVVKVTQWRPASAVEAGGPTSLWGGVARKP